MSIESLTSVSKFRMYEVWRAREVRSRELLQQHSLKVTATSSHPPVVTLVLVKIIDHGWLRVNITDPDIVRKVQWWC